MLDAKTIRAVIEAACVEYDTPQFLADDDARGAVAVALVGASGLDALDLARVDLEVEDLPGLEPWQYFRLAALAYQGGAYSTEFRSRLRDRKVVLVGSELPPGWHESLEEYLEVAAPAEATGMVGCWFIIGSDVDGEEAAELEDAGIVGIQPVDAVIGLVRESAPTLQQLAGLLLAFGGRFKGTVATVRRGYREVVVGLGADSVTISRKAVAGRVYLGGEIVGDPKRGELAVGAAYWALLYALSGTTGDQVTGRLAYLTQLFAQMGEADEQGGGAIYQGRAHAKYDGSLGVLTLGLSPAGIISVANGDGAAVVKALRAAAAIGLPAWPSHQMTSVVCGEGAEAIGVGINGTTTKVVAQSDKAEKTFNRLALTKATCGLAEGVLEQSAFEVELGG